jgi:chemotaxis protein histidine kinase CheA
MDTQAIKQSLLKKFSEVTADRLQKIQLAVIQLEKSESDVAAESVARELHTMKGEARMLGLAAIGQLSHAAEDLLKAAREKKAPGRTAADLLLRVCDLVSDLVEDLEAAHGGNEAVAMMCRTLADASGCEVPALHVSKSVERADRPAPRSPGEMPKPRDQDRTIRVNVEMLDMLGLVTGDLLVESARAKIRAAELNGILHRFSRVSDRLLRQGEALAWASGDRRSLEQLENDLHLLKDDAFRFVRRNADGQNLLHGSLGHLADHIAEARLVPLSTVFEAFPRAVRDIASQQAKRVDFSVENGDLGIDRSMVSGLADSLIHLLRNAVDHGIETSETRAQLGKPAAGQIAIRARADGDMLHIEVADDGRGIDPDRLRQTAVTKGILAPAEAAAMSDRDVIDLIFRSGFSTREQVSEISGRGIGMNVVKQKVELLGGSVTIEGRAGRGTTVLLRVPQSLALLRVLLVRLSDDVYGIPAADVEAVLRVKPADRIDVFGTVAIDYRGKPIALIALGPLLGLNGGPRHDCPAAVVVRQGQDRAALVVDGLLDEREVAVKPCGGEFLKGAPFIAGTAAMEDGRVGVLLQLRDIMAEVRRHSRSGAPGLPARKLRLLVVDDSPIARATASALAKALGHAVAEAQDGEEALLKVVGQSFDAVLTDVQMPNLDGFELTRRLKASAATAALPVIIMSSLTSAEDKRRGADAGADAYLIKGDLGLESLAEVLDRLT